jgi:hypothetical protein
MAGTRPDYAFMQIAPTLGQEQDQERAYEYSFPMDPVDDYSEWVMIPQDVDKVIIACNTPGKFGEYDVEKTNDTVDVTLAWAADGIIWEHPTFTAPGFYDTKPCTAVRLVKKVQPATNPNFCVRAV